MVRKISRIVQTLRDAILLVVSFLLIGSLFRPNLEIEIASYILGGFLAFIFALSIINVILNARKVKRTGYFRSNTILQLIIGLFLTIGLYPPIGIILVVLNAVVLATLWERKSPEERARHPPKPITKKYRAFVAVGVLLMFVATLFSWLSIVNFPLISVYLGSANLTQVSNLVTNPVAMAFDFLGLVGSPISIILGLLGLLKRGFAWASGILAIIAGIGWIVSMTTMAGLGAYIFTVGGALVLAAPIVTK